MKSFGVILKLTDVIYRRCDKINLPSVIKFKKRIKKFNFKSCVSNKHRS